MLKMYCSRKRLLASSWTWQHRASVSYYRNKWKPVLLGFPDASPPGSFWTYFHIPPLLDLKRPKQMSLGDCSLSTCRWHISYQVAQGFCSFMPCWVEISHLRPATISPFWYCMLQFIKEGLNSVLCEWSSSSSDKNASNKWSSVKYYNKG